MQFTYSVHWKETETKFVDRFDRYLEYDFFEHKVHWFSIFNSFMMVIFLCGLVSVILLRTLRNDFAKVCLFMIFDLWSLVFRDMAISLYHRYHNPFWLLHYKARTFFYPTFFYPIYTTTLASYITIILIITHPFISYEYSNHIISTPKRTSLTSKACTD